MKLLKEIYESAKFMITEPLFKELKEYLKSNKIYIDEFYFENNEIFGEITWGDWKHDHHAADWYVKQFFAERDIEVRHEQWTTDSNDSDTYSARHVWRLFSRNSSTVTEEPLRVENEIVEPTYIKENLNSLLNASATTVEDIIAGMIGNVSDDEIDRSLSIFNRIAVTLGVKDYTDMQVLVHDGDYDLSQYGTMFSFVSDVYKTKNVKLYIIDERGSDVFKAVQEVYAGGTYFIYAKDVLTLDRIVQAVENYNNGDSEEIVTETTQHQLDNREKTLYNNIRNRLGVTNLAGTLEQWTDAEKREQSEIRCISMIHSILAYAHKLDYTVDYVMSNRYLKRYIDELGEDNVKVLAAEEIEEFNKATVKYAGTDSEGNSYNRVIFKESEGVGNNPAKEDSFEVYVDVEDGDDGLHIPADWYTESKWNAMCSENVFNAHILDFNSMTNEIIPDDIRNEISDTFYPSDEDVKLLVNKYPKLFRYSTITEEMTDLVHDEWEQPDVDVAVFVKGEYQIKKLSDDDADKEEWEVMHFKGDTNEGTSMGKCDSLAAAKKKADDDAKNNEPKIVNENFITEPTVGKSYYFTKNDNIYSGTFKRKTRAWYFFEDENGNEIPTSIFTSISDNKEELENLLGIVDKIEKDTKVPTTVPNRWTRVPNQHGKPIGESNNAGFKIYAKNIKVGDKFVSTKSAVDEYIPHKTFTVTEIEDIGKDELMIKFVSDEGEERDKIFCGDDLIGFVPNSNLTESDDNEYETRKSNYLKAKADFEKYGEEDNNDVLSREEKMNIAKAEFEKIGGTITEDLDNSAITQFMNTEINDLTLNIIKPAVDIFFDEYKTLPQGMDALDANYAELEGEFYTKYYAFAKKCKEAVESNVFNVTGYGCDDILKIKCKDLCNKVDWIFPYGWRSYATKANLVTEEYDPKDTEFNDKYFPRVDLNDSNIHYYKLDNDEFAYDMKNAVVMFLFKDGDEVEHFGVDKAPYRVLDTVGLSRDSWNDKPERDEYLRGYKQDLDDEASYLVQDFIKNELPMYQKDIK